MHYSNEAFSNDGEQTLISKADPSLKFGQRIQWTCLDVKEINRLYDCPAVKCDSDFFVPNMTQGDVIRRKKRDEARRDNERDSERDNERDDYRSRF